MNVPISAAQAGRIRDAMRLTRAAGVIAALSLIGSFFWDPSILGFAVWPVVLGLILAALYPLLRPIGVVPVALVSLVGVAGAVIEFVGVVVPPASGQYRISPIFGAGTICVGAWLIGTAAIARDLRVLPATVCAKTIWGGLGVLLVGVSWFVDAVPGLILLLIGAFLGWRVGTFFKALGVYGLPPAMPPRTPPPADVPDLI